MYSIKNSLKIFLVLLLAFSTSCENLEEVNINPNGVDPANAHPNLLMATISTSTAQRIISLGYGDIAGVMQHTQKDGWSGSHNSYEWTDQSWSSYYGILRNNAEFMKKAENLGLEFHQGVGLVMKSYVFGLVTDLWGDAPYSKALMGENGGEALKPAFDSQKDIYTGILADLEKANTLLSKPQGDYADINPTQDVIYNGNVASWRKFANSLALRYYMRIAEKEADMAKSGIEKIVSNLETYPIMLDASDDANIAYAGTSESDSWPANTVFDGSAGSNFRRLKLCSTLVETLQRYSDPRLDLWASKVAIPIMVDETLAAGTDIIESGVRYVASDIAADYENRYGFALDVDPEYVGLPPAWSIVPQAYNLNPNLEQAPQNPHASHLNDIYKKASGQHLKARLLTAAEIHFILAEAAIKGWSVGSAEDHYNNGVMASFGAWDLGSGYENYISGNGVSFDGTLAQVMEQKWIASWTAAAEAWFDYRRTGLPDLQAGINVKRTVLPIRFYYSVGEMDYNPDNITVAINNLEATDYTAPDGKNSAWSKMWVLQGIEKPW